MIKVNIYLYYNLDNNIDKTVFLHFCRFYLEETMYSFKHIQYITIWCYVPELTNRSFLSAVPELVTIK